MTCFRGSPASNQNLGNADITLITTDFAGTDASNLQRSGMGRDSDTAARTPRHPLPRLPRGLRWPVDFDKAPEFGRYPKAPGGVVAYLKREWKEIIAAGMIDMPTLREHFPRTAAAINTYTKPHPETGVKRTLPKNLTIPILEQVNDRLVARVLAGKEVVSPKDVPRLYAALRRRALVNNPTS